MTLDLPVEADYDICSTFPRKVLDDETCIKDAGLFPSGSLVVEDRLWE